MTTLIWIRLAVAAIGFVVWAYGYRVDDPMVRWIGIAFLAVAVLLRFVPSKRTPPPA
jgi:hypothetical protein